MAYCRECGKEINDKAVICPGCGCATGVNAFPIEIKDKDTGVLGWFLFSFVLPFMGLIAFGIVWSVFLSLVGVILGLIWKESKPYCSKACLKGSLCGFILIILVIVMDVFIFNNFLNL